MSPQILETHYGIPDGCQEEDQLASQRKDKIVKCLSRLYEIDALDRRFVASLAEIIENTLAK